MTSAWNNLDPLRQRIEAVDDADYALGFVFDRIESPSRAWAGGHRLLLAGSNNYLGLSFHRPAIEASAEAVYEFGLGTTGSRLANGTLSYHRQLELEIAEVFDRRGAIVSSTGYQANVGVLSSLPGVGDVVFVDDECHASILDGCRLGGVRFRRFRHNDAADLETKLKTTPARNRIIIVEGIYSMSGDRADLRPLIEVKEANNALLIVDEAHAFGVLGAHGRGLSEEQGVEDHVDIITGTFSKSLGAIGGFAVGNHENFDMLRFASRSYVFTASLPAPIVQGVRSALSALRDGEELRAKLMANLARLGAGLTRAGLPPTHSDSPVVALRIGETEHAIALWKALLGRGVYVNMIVPPASPDGAAMLRLSISAAHSEDDIAEICTAMEGALRDVPEFSRGRTEEAVAN
jgi:8-amino-7-oxononanoate synthase